MAKKRGAFLNKFFLGKEKSEDYARNTLPTNRWELFWDILKNNFGKLVLLNLLVLLFFVPLVFLIIFRIGLMGNYASIFPFSQSFGVGYGAPFSMAGYTESINFSVNAISFFFLPVVGAIAAVGLSGGAYCMRNMVWTEGVFVANDFWRGIKLNYKKILLICLFYSFVFYIFVLSVSYCNQAIAINNLKVLFIILKIIAIIFLIFFSIVALHMITLTVTYELGFYNLFKNSVILTIGLIVLDVFFITLAAIPFVLLFFGGISLVIGIILLLLFGFSYCLLILTDYSQYVFDQFINPRIEGAQTKRGIYDKVVKNNKALEQYKNQSYLRNISSKYASTPIKPITDDEITIEELPTSFSRDDLIKLNESKNRLYEDNQKYIEEHQNDERYQLSTNDKEKKEKTQKEIEKAKRELEKRDKK